MGAHKVHDYLSRVRGKERLLCPCSDHWKVSRDVLQKHIYISHCWPFFCALLLSEKKRVSNGFLRLLLMCIGAGMAGRWSMMMKQPLSFLLFRKKRFSFFFFYVFMMERVLLFLFSCEGVLAVVCTRTTTSSSSPFFKPPYS